MKNAVTILGAGAWGTALAHLFATKGYAVFLWCYEDAVAQSINKDRVNNLFLKNVLLPKTIYASTDIHAILSHDIDFVIEAIPVSYLSLVLEQIDTQKALSHCWVLTSKGLHPKTGKHALQIMHYFFGEQLKTIVLGGPSFASELVQGLPTACVAATTDQNRYNLFKTYWKSSYTAIEYSDDFDGVLFCGAFKNVVAVWLGMLDGAGYGKNTQAFMLTYAFTELKKLVVAFGGQEKTVDGLAGFGDLFLTASTNVSKNRMYGCMVGQKKSMPEIHKQLPVAPEGVSTAAGLHCLLTKHKDLSEQFPLLYSVHHIIIGLRSVTECVDAFFI